MRRRFYEFYAAAKSPLAAEVLACLGRLYEVEADICGQLEGQRKQARQERSWPSVEALQGWLQDHAGRVSAASGLAEAIRYALRLWPGLVVFLKTAGWPLIARTRCLPAATAAHGARRLARP